MLGAGRVAHGLGAPLSAGYARAVNGRPESEPAGRGDPIPAHPNVPRRAGVALALSGVVVAGLLGVLIGWGLVDTTCTGSCGGALAAGSMIGGAGAAIGAGIVAVLVLRAMAEWKRHPPDSSSPRNASRS